MTVERTIPTHARHISDRMSCQTSKHTNHTNFRGVLCPDVLSGEVRLFAFGLRWKKGNWGAEKSGGVAYL